MIKPRTSEELGFIKLAINEHNCAQINNFYSFL